MIAVRYYKASPCPLSQPFVEQVVGQAARHEKKICGSVEITMVNETTIKKLNREHRGKNSATDVLSFPWKESGSKESFLGELFICYPYIVRQAKRFNMSTREEFVRMLAHGLLHLVGHDHVKSTEASKMFNLQEKIVSDSLKKYK
jgi:probable rRNA maturation factor